MGNAMVSGRRESVEEEEVAGLVKRVGPDHRTEHDDGVRKAREEGGMGSKGSISDLESRAALRRS